MDATHPKKPDPRPKRRKDKDNPYEIFSVGINTGQPHYYLSFVDSSGVKQCMEIDKALFDAFDRFELDEISFMHKVDKHYDKSEQTEEMLYKRAINPPTPVEEIVAQQTEIDELHRAIAQLPEKQRRRLVMYYFGEFTYDQIAEMEGCTIMPVKRSIDVAIEKLKKLLK